MWYLLSTEIQNETARKECKVMYMTMVHKYEGSSVLFF